MPLPHIVPAALQRDEVFAEYGAGGPPFLMKDLEKLPKPWGSACETTSSRYDSRAHYLPPCLQCCGGFHAGKTLIATLQWREAEGRRKMCRTAKYKFVHDAMGDDLDVRTQSFSKMQSRTIYWANISRQLADHM